MKNKRIMPPTYFWIYCALSVVISFLPVGRFLSFPWNLIGILFIVLGLLLAVWVEGVFKRAKTTVKPFEKTAALVTGGPFRFSRNPMYFGMTVIFIGITIILGNFLCLIGAIAFVITMNIRFIKFEEAKMTETFGAEYIQYKQNVRRWI